MPKPRSNHDACAYWADGILTNEPQPSIDVNSIIVRGDVVYSFGSHFPMGIILRNSQGRCTRVLLNSDWWAGGNGWANTGGDQSSCRMEANERIARAGWKIELQSVPLTCSGRKDIRCRPVEGDDEPPYPHLEVPTYFFRTDPGPEPVKDPRGCVAGQREEYEYQDDNYITSNLDLYADDQMYAGTVNDPLLGSPRSIKPGLWLWRQSHGSIYSKTMHTGAIEWGEESSWWGHYQTNIQPSGVTYKQCPHCAAFDRVHADWSRKFKGGWRRSERGYEEYAKWIDIFETEAEWREGRLRDWRRVREGRKAYKEWYDRNHIPYTAVTWTRVNGTLVPNIDRDGYPTRKDQEAYYRSQREQARAERRREKAREEREKMERQLERLRRKREAKADFETRARIVARDLANLKQRMVTH